MLPDYDDPRVWLDIAERDRESAKLILQAGEWLTAQAGFHIQQAIEKALKGLIVAQGRRVPRTHDIEMLLKLCDKSAFLEENWNDLVASTYFAVLARYPGPAPPRLDDVHRASRAMEKLLIWAGSQIGKQA